MIEKNEILRFSKDLSLKPDTIEKDYVLNWILWGISQSVHFSSSWSFKGGTSLNKCFFETFRFSEDLDFTLKENHHLNADFLKKEFSNISQVIYEKTGIEFFQDKFKFKIFPKENGQASAKGKIHYNGPLRRKHGFSSIKLDLTTDEVLVLPPTQKIVHHPYSDKPKSGIWANCLEPFFNWLIGSLNEEYPLLPKNIDGEALNPGRISGASPINSFLHKIQFAAANRVCIKLIYHEKKRTIEPLLFRTSLQGKQLFYGYEREGEKVKAFSLSKIQSVEISNLPYIEKYPVEITSTGSISMPPIRSKG